MGAELQRGKVIGSDYEVVRKLTDGSFGPLYVVRDRDLGTEFVLKINLPWGDLASGAFPMSTNVSAIAKFDHIRRSRNEADITNRVNHPNVIKISKLVGIEGGMVSKEECLGILYEKISDVRTLREVIDSQEGHVGPNVRKGASRLEDYVSQLREVVASFRLFMILHKDLKPENILIDTGRVVKVIDFGLASKSGEDNGLYGNSLYGPPEFLQRRQHLNSDVWSFGLIAVELLTGKYLFEGYDKRGLSVLLARLAEECESSGEEKLKEGWAFTPEGVVEGERRAIFHGMYERVYHAFLEGKIINDAINNRFYEPAVTTRYAEKWLLYVADSISRSIEEARAVWKSGSYLSPSVRLPDDLYSRVIEYSRMLHPNPACRSIGYDENYSNLLYRRGDVSSQIRREDHNKSIKGFEEIIEGFSPSERADTFREVRHRLSRMKWKYEYPTR